MAGDPKYWEDRALNLFPQIGLCTNNTYTLHGREYKMDIHGFIKDTVLAPAECGDSRLVLACEDTEETRAIYPFRFRYAIAYTLDHQTLDITVTVDNRDSQTMYFSVGGHPGFNLPWRRAWPTTITACSSPPAPPPSGPSAPPATASCWARSRTTP